MEDLRITGLTLFNVGVFEHLELSFEKLPLEDKAEIHIFTGENGTGKSTLLEALTSFDRFFNPYLQNDKHTSLNEDILIQKTRKVIGEGEKKPNVKISFPNREMRSYPNHHGNYYTNMDHTNMDYFTSYYADNANFNNYHTYNFFAYKGHRQISDSKVEAFRKIEFNPIAEALMFNKTTVNENLFQWIANNKTRAALSFQKGNIKDSENYLRTMKKVETAIGEIIDRKVEFIVDEHSLNVMVNLDDKPIHFSTLADGYKSVISWLTDLMFRLDYMPEEGRENFTLFLDEIDVHLHPAAQRRILPVIQKLFPKAQIFLTTHSPFVIGSVDDAWIYKFKLDENRNSVLDGPPVRSEDGNSYRYIVESIFGIKKQFGEEVETKLDNFNTMRTEVLKNPSDTQLLKKLVKSSRELASQSIELQSIIGNELKQLSRILKTEITM